MSKPRDILVIDDEPVVLEGVARIGAGEGLSVDPASSAREGLDLMGRRAYRLVLCDIMMEGEDGFQFLAEVARRGHRAPIVLTTGYCRGEHAVRALQGGALDYLAKPFTADELLAVLERGFAYGEIAAEAVPPPCPPGLHGLGHVSWARPEAEGTMRIGIQDLFVKTLPGVERVDMLPGGGDLVQGAPCASVISRSGLAHRVLAPMSGQIIDLHEAIAGDPAALARDPYGEGWLYRILPCDVQYDLMCLAAGADPLAPTPARPEGEPP